MAYIDEVMMGTAAPADGAASVSPPEGAVSAPPADTGVAPAPPAEPVTPAPIEPDYRALAEERERLLADRDKQLEEAQRVAREEWETRMRLEGTLNASREKPASAAPQAPLEQDAKSAFDQRYQTALGWAGQNIIPAALTAPELTALDDLAAKALGVAANDPTVTGLRDWMMAFGGMMLRRNVEMMALNNAHIGSSLEQNIPQAAQTHVQQQFEQREQAAVAHEQGTEAFRVMHTEMFPHLNEHYNSLPGAHPEAPEAPPSKYQQAYIREATRIADEIAQEMSADNQTDRIKFIAALTAQGKQDLKQEYLRRVGKSLEREFGVTAAPPALARQAAASAPKGRAQAPAPGITPSARQPVVPELADANAATEDVVGELEQLERAAGLRR